MRLRELYEAKARRIVAVMPGGFHPFHPGHKSLYDWAVKTFGQSNVYVAATNDTAARPFPFDVKKKLAAMAGVPESNFIQVKSPFNAMSYKDIVDSDTALVFVRSEKDKNEQPLPDQTKKNGEPGYLRSYTGKDLNTSDEMGYMAYGPTINFDFSGMQIKSASELRATWPEMSDEDKLKAAKLMYGNGAPIAVKLLDQALGDTEAPVGEAIDQRKAEEIIKNAIQHLLNRIDDKKITLDQAHKTLDDDLDGMIEDGYKLANDLKFRDFAHKMLEEFTQRMMARDESVEEILGFATKNPKRATVKKKRPPEELSVKDKLAKRRAMAAKGNPNAYKTGGIEESQQLSEAVWFIPLIMAAARVGGGALVKQMAKKGAQEVAKKGAAQSAKSAAKQTAKAAAKAPKAIKDIGVGVGVGSGGLAALEIAEILGDAYDVLKEVFSAIELAEIAKVVKDYGIPALAVVGLLYGGYKIYDYLSKDEEPVEDASPDEEDEFHRKLDKLVHKTFGHSSDEKKKKKQEDAPPGREKQVKALKKKFDDPGAPYAIAWAQHNKSGKPKRKSRG